MSLSPNLFDYRGVLKVNLSYLKGKRSTWELTSQGLWVNKSGDISTSLPPVLGRSKSDVMMTWSLLTSDDERYSEAVSTLSF